jgi:DNA polymerase-3 subunit delta'
LGQETAKAFLAESIKKDIFPHSLLVHGPGGVGQSGLLMDLSDILLCSSESNRPCGTCPRCLERKHRNCDNLVTIFPHLDTKQKTKDNRIDATKEKLDFLFEEPYGFTRSPKEHISIDQIRDLKERLSFSEIKERKRFVLIFWVDSLHDPAANALLKILEEPPSNTYFLLHCENRHQLLPTILSRCVQVRLHSLPISVMSQYLKKESPATMEALSPAFLQLADGSLGRCYQFEKAGGMNLLESALLFIKFSISGAWFKVSDLIDRERLFQEMESGILIFELVLEIARFIWQTGGKTNLWGEDICQGISKLTYPEAYVKMLEDIILALAGHSKPQIAIMGNIFALQCKVANRLEAV